MRAAIDGLGTPTTPCPVEKDTGFCRPAPSTKHPADIPNPNGTGRSDGYPDSAAGGGPIQKIAGEPPARWRASKTTTTSPLLVTGAGQSAADDRYRAGVVSSLDATWRA